MTPEIAESTIANGEGNDEQHIDLCLRRMADDSNFGRLIFHSGSGNLFIDRESLRPEPVVSADDNGHLKPAQLNSLSGFDD